MKVLVVGSGGREHALCWKLAQSPKVSEVLCAPGNPGTALVARNVDVAVGDLQGLVALAQGEDVALVVIGPEDPLVAGLADRMREADIPTFGPGANGSQLEGSKIFAKSFLERYRIPTAAARPFDRSGAAKSYLESCGTWPLVVKAEGLAGGKGVFVCANVQEGLSAVNAIMEECRYGKAGDRVLIEEFMEGEEASVFAITDGKTILIMEAVQDHKQVGEGDQGPNTGGMGVHSPVDALNERLYKQIEQRVLVQTLHGLRQEGMDYRGVLFVGLMLTDSGPRVVEYNVRFGDPECQALMLRLKGDLFTVLLAAANGDLASIDPPHWDPRPVVGVVAAAKGYPGTAQTGDLIRGLEEASAVEDAMVFHAGTRAVESGIQTSGGRVLCVTALGADKEEARERAYSTYDLIEWDGKFCRRDIGTRNEARAAVQAAAKIEMELLGERD